MGAPQKPIDFEVLDKLLYIQCTELEVSAVMECSVDTLNAAVKEHSGLTFSEYSQQKKGVGKVSLRRAQHRNAVEHNNTAMQIWLGKQYLGQAEKTETVVRDTAFEKTSDDDLVEFIKTRHEHYPSKA
jgi:hypothetical protein